MYKYLILDHFAKQLKSIVKKHRTVKQKMIEVLISFRKEQAISLGNGVYKLRIGTDGGGKSGGYRILIWVLEIEHLIVPFCIYAKSERENISLKDMNNHLAKIKADFTS